MLRLVSVRVVEVMDSFKSIAFGIHAGELQQRGKTSTEREKQKEFSAFLRYGRWKCLDDFS